MQKMNVKAAAIAAGLTWAFYIVCAGWAAAAGWGGRIVDLFGSCYIGYGPTILGGVFGGIWAFFDGLVAGLIFRSEELV